MRQFLARSRTPCRKFIREDREEDECFSLIPAFTHSLVFPCVGYCKNFGESQERMHQHAARAAREAKDQKRPPLSCGVFTRARQAVLCLSDSPLQPNSIPPLMFSSLAVSFVLPYSFMSPYFGLTNQSEHFDPRARTVNYFAAMWDGVLVRFVAFFF